MKWRIGVIVGVTIFLGCQAAIASSHHHASFGKSRERGRQSGHASHASHFRVEGRRHHRH